jgi:hypothetical protein
LGTSIKCLLRTHNERYRRQQPKPMPGIIQDFGAATPPPGR